MKFFMMNLKKIRPLLDIVGVHTRHFAWAGCPDAEAAQDVPKSFGPPSMSSLKRLNIAYLSATACRQTGQKEHAGNRQADSKCFSWKSQPEFISS